ncbi:DUF6069 family protein [Streptomyces sp. SID13031]|uniref:DUF6069 family protein n=1 Tax=Streptomyces sp. SID13031 TaxID=2706046 RepID=UPI0013C6D6F5|nr:DUF6069 family protein [Streptomyces sp. SID13031]NEA30423.1 hypothetical protein [Streptomyces sp. SID13031]
MTRTSSTTAHNPIRVAGRSRLAIVGITALEALAWWAMLAQVFGITLEAKQGSVVRIGAVSVFVASVAMAFAGWGLLALLERRTLAARETWTSVALIACILSLGGPLTSGIGIGAKLGLASLHLLVGSVVILGLRRTALSAADRRRPAFWGRRADR